MSQAESCLCARRGPGQACPLEEKDDILPCGAGPEAVVFIHETVQDFCLCGAKGGRDTLEDHTW